MSVSYCNFNLKSAVIWKLLKNIYIFTCKTGLLYSCWIKKSFIWLLNVHVIDVCYSRTTILNIRDAFLRSFQEFRNCLATLAFVKKPLSADVAELNFSASTIDIGAFEMQLLEEKERIVESKLERLNGDLEKLEKNKCDSVYSKSGFL